MAVDKEIQHICEPSKLFSASEYTTKTEASCLKKHEYLSAAQVFWCDVFGILVKHFHSGLEFIARDVSLNHCLHHWPRLYRVNLRDKASTYTSHGTATSDRQTDVYINIYIVALHHSKTFFNNFIKTLCYAN